MNRFRYMAIGMLLVVALGVSAQQTAASPAGSDKAEHGQTGVSALDQHMKILTERLELTADQQAKLRPIVKEFLDGRQKLVADQSLTDETRSQKIRALHAKAEKEARGICTDEQKKKLDELEAEQHHP